MSTHEDWLSAKERREDMAIRAARALVNGNVADAQTYALAFDTADDDMRDLGQELDGGQ